MVVRYNRTTMSTRCRLLVAHLTRCRINPHQTSPPPRPRGGYASQTRPRWDDSLNTAIDTERALLKLSLEARLLLLIVHGFGLTQEQAAWLLHTSPRTIGRHLTAAERRFNAVTYGIDEDT
jgi:DNA-directed RNA polymerase specialized sigma24 family protein